MSLRAFEVTLVLWYGAAWDFFLLFLNLMLASGGMLRLGDEGAGTLVLRERLCILILGYHLRVWIKDIKFLILQVLAQVVESRPARVWLGCLLELLQGNHGVTYRCC